MLNASIPCSVNCEESLLFYEARKITSEWILYIDTLQYSFRRVLAIDYERSE